MTALRNRLVTEHDGRTHVSKLLIDNDDIGEVLDYEQHLYERTGWHVTRALRCAKDENVWWVWVRSLPALEDTTDRKDGNA